MNIQDELKELDLKKKELEVTEYKLLEKAFRSDDVTDIVKAQSYYQQVLQKVQKNNNTSQSKSLILDPQQVISSSGRWLEKPIQVSFGMLRAMSRTPIPRAIITTRKDQVAEFATPQEDRFGTGFIIRPKKSGTQRDDAKEITNQQKKDIDQIIEFIIGCGEESQNWHGDDFEQFLRKITEDSLALDQMTFEIVRNRGGMISEYFATDAGTYRYADSIDLEQQGENKKVKGYFPSYVQLYQNNVWAEFYPWELCFGVRNPQTDIFFNGYGRSELEDLISTVTAMLYADQYNSNFFRVGSNPKGILRVTGNISQPRLDEFRQQWLSQVSGVQNSHKLPVIEADKMEWVTTQLPNKDMEFSKYQEYLIRVACAIYKISPLEIGFHIEGENAGGLGGNGGNKEELIYSKDKGLKPLLRFLQAKINKYLVAPYCEAKGLSSKYEFMFAGMDIETEQQEEERLIKALGGPYMEINEARRKKGLKEKPEYDIIQSPVVASMKQAEMYGGQQSNQFMDEEEDTYKAEDNPMAKGLQDFWDKLANE